MRLAARSLLFVLPVLYCVLLMGLIHTLRADSNEPSASEKRTYQLKYKFKPNQFVHYNVVHKVTVTTQKGSRTEVAFNQTKTRKHYRVVFADREGNGTLDPVLDRVQMQVRFGEEDVRFWDSQLQKDPTGPFKQVARTIGKPLNRIKASSCGIPISVTPLTSKPDESERDKTQQEQVRSILMLLPENPVKIGESWRERYEISIPLGKKLTRKIQMSRHYTLKSVEQNRATVSVATSVLTPITALDTLGQLALQQAESKGTIVFDLEQGIIVSREIKCDDRVVGLYGPDSSLHSQSVLTAQYVPQESVAEKSEKTNTE